MLKQKFESIHTKTPNQDSHTKSRKNCKKGYFIETVFIMFLVLQFMLNIYGKTVFLKALAKKKKKPLIQGKKIFNKPFFQKKSQAYKEKNDY